MLAGPTNYIGFITNFNGKKAIFLSEAGHTTEPNMAYSLLKILYTKGFSAFKKFNETVWISEKNLISKIQDQRKKKFAKLSYYGSGFDLFQIFNLGSFENMLAEKMQLAIGFERRIAKMDGKSKPTQEDINKAIEEWQPMFIEQDGQKKLVLLNADMGNIKDDWAYVAFANLTDDTLEIYSSEKQGNSLWDKCIFKDSKINDVEILNDFANGYNDDNWDLD